MSDGRRDPASFWWVPAGALGLAAAAVGWARYVEPRRLEVTSFDVPLGGLPAGQGISVLHVSDIHAASLSISAKQFVRMLGPEALSCPLLCLTGDFCDRPQDLPALERFLAPVLHAMAAQRGQAVSAYAVWGNHDKRAGIAALRSLLQHLGVVVLENSAVAAGGFWIAGVCDPTRREDRLQETLSGIPAGVPVLLLAHNPTIFPRAAAAGVPLTLAGHTHGGQVRLGGLSRLRGRRTARWSRGGWYADGVRRMYVSRGVGTSFLPVRLGARPEVSVFRLQPAGGA